MSDTWALLVGCCLRQGPCSDKFCLVILNSVIHEHIMSDSTVSLFRGCFVLLRCHVSLWPVENKLGCVPICHHLQARNSNGRYEKSWLKLRDNFDSRHCSYAIRFQLACAMRHWGSQVVLGGDVHRIDMKFPPSACTYLARQQHL